MLNRIYFLFVITLLIGSAEVYSQTANPSRGCLPLSVNFTPPPGQNEPHFWDFKDGVTSNNASPTNIYNQPGTYVVEYKKSATGSIVGTVTVTVYATPVLNFSVNTGCAPLNAQFQNTSVINPAINITNYVWTFGDGNSSVGVQNPTHMYNTPGTYNISLNIQTEFPSCTKTAIFNNAVNVLSPPVANFTTNPENTFICGDSANIVFTNASSGTQSMTYSWNFGNGNTSSATNPAAQKYPAQGNYTATLTARYPGLAGCVSTTSRGITIWRPQPVINQTAETVCINNGVQFSTTTPGLYTWSFDDGTSFNAAEQNNSNINVTYTTPGLHQAILTVTSFDGTCPGWDTAYVYVDEVTASIVSTPSFICSSPGIINYQAVTNQPANVSYLWGFSNGATSTNSTVDITYYSATDSIYYSVNVEEPLNTSLLVVSNITGCSASANVRDTLWIPNAYFRPDITRGCAPLTVIFDDSSTTFFGGNDIVSWHWIFGDGNTLTKGDSTFVTYEYNTPGEYYARLLVTTSRGCIDTSFAILIEVGEPVTTDFTISSTNICPGEQVQFVVDPLLPLVDGYRFSSEGNRVFHCSDETTVDWVYNYENGPQDVSLIVDYNGCFTTITKTAAVTVGGAIAKIDYYALCSDPLTYHFKDESLSAAAPALTWDFGDGSGTGTGTTESYTYAATGDYTVTLEANAGDGCPATTDEVTVYVRNVQAEIDMDTLLCVNVVYPFSAANSIDAYGNCYTGYTWQFPTMANRRPHTSGNDITGFSFTETGWHTARLIVTDINGCRDTTTKEFKIYDMTVTASALTLSVTPQRDAVALPICNPTAVEFYDNSVSDTTKTDWLWTFGSLGTSTDVTPSFTFSDPPDPGLNYYPITLRLTDILGCVEYFNMNIFHYAPVSNISIDKPNHCIGDSITIQASDFTDQGSNLSYSWDFGDGDQTSTDQVNKIVWPEVQGYTINLDFVENSTGCPGSTSAVVDIQSYPTAIFTTNVDDKEVYCDPEIVIFTGNPESDFMPLTHYWDLGVSGMPPLYVYGVNSSEASITYSKGTYDVTYAVFTSYGCYDTIQREFKVHLPEGNFDMDRNTICKGEEITFTIRDTSDVETWTWAFGDGNTIDNVAPTTYRYNFHPPSGQTLATLLLRGVDGICPNAVQHQVNIHQVIADFERLNELTDGDTVLCANEGVYTFTNRSQPDGGANNVFSWDFGDGTTLGNIINPPPHLYENSGIYNVRLTIENSVVGCKDTLIKQAMVSPLPVVVAVGDTNCLGLAIQMNVVNPDPLSSFAWTPSDGLSDPNIHNPLAMLAANIEYRVTETDKHGCSSDTNAYAIVIAPIGLSDWDTTIVIGDQAILPVYGQNVYIFTWTPEEGLTCLDCNYPGASPMNDIVYHIEVNDVRNCFYDEYDFTIYVRPETFIKMPTAFSPNGDDTNDKLYVKGWGIKDLLEFQIFNRWGQLIYSSSDINEGWDGKFKGVIQNSDIYVYKVKALDWRDKELFVEGHINLLH